MEKYRIEERHVISEDTPKRAKIKLSIPPKTTLHSDEPALPQLTIRTYVYTEKAVQKKQRQIKTVLQNAENIMQKEMGKGEKDISDKSRWHIKPLTK